MRCAAVPIFALTVGGLSLAPTATSHASPQGHYTQGLWTVMILSSSHPESKTRRICLNGTAAPAELRTCAGSVNAPETYRAATEAVSCTSMAGKQTMSVVVSNDANTIRNRTEFEPDVSIRAAIPPSGDNPALRKLLAKAMQKSWAESTMTYEGACPVPLKDEQPFVVVKPDGTIVDPFQAPTCMVDALKTVDGVTAPKAGYVWDPDGGPLPFVRYTYPSRNSSRAADVTFTADGYFLDDPTKGQFLAAMSGLSSGAEGPDEFGAEKIMKLWKDRCGVAGNIVFR
jgi:hypothetical protein